MTGEGLLRLRPELVISEQDGAYVVKDPVRQTFARLGAAEMLVAQHFDGASTLHDIQERLERERGVVAPLPTLERFRDRLHGLQLITEAGEIVAPADSELGVSQGRLRRLVVVQLPLTVDPDRVLGVIAGRLRWAFTSWAGIAAAVLVGAGVAVWALQGATIWAQLPSLWSVRGVVLVVVAAVVSGALHELAHGVGVKVFGGSVRRMGAFLYFGLPALYTDVSDAWLFPDKRRRAAVVVAGVAVTGVVWAAASLGWWAGARQGVAGEVVLAVMLVNLFGGVRTLVPFLKGDGYYLLSNALDMPNLRDRSFAYARARLQPAAGNLPIPSDVPVDRQVAGAREARIYLAYAIGTVLFAAAVVVFAVVLLFSAISR